MRKVLKIVGVLFLLYLVVGFGVIPLTVRHIGEDVLQEKVDGEATIAKVGFNPFTWRLRVQGIVLPNSSADWSASVEEVVVDLSVDSILTWGPVLDEILIREPSVRLVLSENDVTSEIEEAPEEARSWQQMIEQINGTEVPELTLGRFELSAGKIEFVDRTRSSVFSETIEPISILLEDFTTVQDSNNRFQLSAILESGAELSIEASFADVPRQTEGKIQLNNVELSHLSPYFSDFIQFDLNRAVYNLDLEYELNLTNPEKLLTLRIPETSISELLCIPLERDNRIISIDEVSVKEILFEFPSMNLELGRVEISDGETRIHRDKEGKIDLLTLVAAPQPTSEKQVEEPSSASIDTETNSLTVLLKELEISNYLVLWEDSLEAGKASLAVKIASAKISNVTSDPEVPFSFYGSYELGEGGEIEVEGELAPNGSKIDLDVKLKDSPLALAELYAEEFLDTDLESGMANFDLKIVGGIEEGFQVSGNGAITDFAVHKERAPSVSGKWAALEFEELHFRTEPLAFSSKAINLRDPELVLKLPEGTASGESEKEVIVQDAMENEAEEKQVPDVSVEIFSLENGIIKIVDRKVEPEVEVELSELSVDVTNIGLSGDELSDWHIGGKLWTADFDIEGQSVLMKPEENTKIQFELNRLNLPTLSPYAGKAVGRRIDKGWVSLESDWSIESQQLSASNRILVDELQFGESVPSETAIRLPLDLAVTLLKGPNGKMDLSLPLSGDLSDPKASMRQIIQTAFVGLITNVVSAPFKMLSSIVGNDVDLSLLEFDTDQTQLETSQVDHLNALAKALKARPEIHLKAAASFSEVELKQVKIDQLKERLFKDETVVSDADFHEQINEAYRKDKDIPISESAQLPLDEMIEALIAEITVEASRLTTISQQRLLSVESHLIQSQGIESTRIVIEEEFVEGSRSGVVFELE